MLSMNTGLPIYLYAGRVDMRKGFDGLLALVQQHGGHTGLDGAWYVFLSKRSDRMKILYFDHDGLALWYKRLEQGRFQWPAIPSGTTVLSVEPSLLRLILDGIDISKAHRRKRYRRPAVA